MADLEKIRPVLPHRVYRRDQWRDEWELVPFLFCNGCTLSFAPEIPQAELEHQFGRVYWPDTGAFDDYDDLDLLGDFVKIVIESPDGEILWIGQVVDEIRNLRGGDVRQLPSGQVRRGSGMQTFIALGLEHALRRTIVDRAFYMDELANLTNTIEIRRALVFNEENEHGGAGNRSRTVGAGDVCFLFTDDLARGLAWSSLEILYYLMVFFTPRDVNGEREITFDLHQSVIDFVPNFDQPRLRPQNRNLFELLSSLIDRRRLLSWRIVYDAEDRPSIAVAPFNHQDITTPGGNLYQANPATVQLDFDNSIDVTRTVLRRSLANSFHEVVVRGERIRTCFTCAHGYNSLDADWKLDDQTAYNAGPASLGGLDRSDRERRVNNFRREDRFRRVYAAFRLPDDFDGHTDNDSINPPDLDFESLDFYRPGLRFLRHTLIRDLQSQDGAHPFLPMAAYLRLPSESPERFVQLDQLGGLAGVESAEAKEGVDFSASVAPLPDDAGVLLRITGAPQHVIASSEFVPLTTISEKPAIFNWQTSLFITVAMELDGYCEGRYAQLVAADVDMTRTLVIDLGDRLRLDWITPDTIVRLNDGQLITSAGEYVRDDRPLAKDLARIAFDYHAVERQALSIAWRQVREIAALGSLITFIGGGLPGQTLEPVHALVTGVAFDLVRGSTTATTDFAELDLVALLQIMADLELDKRRLAALERELAELRAELTSRAREPVLNRWRNPRLAKTVRVGEDYPSESANTFGIVFLDSTFTESEGAQSTTDVNRQAAPAYVARTVDGSFVAENQVVGVFHDSERWWIIPAIAGKAPVRFRLTATLALGASAAAVIETWDSGSSQYVDGDAITVLSYGGAANPPGAWSGPAGYRGFAIELEGRYEILWMQRVALFARVTLAEDMGDTTPGVSLAATVNAYWRGQNPGTQVNVYDAAGIHADKLTGDKGVVCWNDALARYEILDMDQAGVKIQWGYATADWTNAAGNGAYVVCELADPQSKDATAGDGGGTFNVYLPRRGVPRDPNVRQGAVIGFIVDDEGSRVCVTDYLDDPIKDVKLFHGPVGDIPAGWQLCDGTNGTPDLREKFVLGAYGNSGGTADFDDDGHSTNIGNMGGRRSHAHDPHNLNLPHLRSGSAALRTEDRSLDITASPGFTVETTDVTLNATLFGGSGQATLNGTTSDTIVTVEGTGSTGTAIADLGPHPKHIHIVTSLDALQVETSTTSGKFAHEATGAFANQLAVTTDIRDGGADDQHRYHRDDVANGANDPGHEHDLTGVTFVEASPGHHHDFSGVFDFIFHTGLPVTIFPNPHHHEVPVAPIASALDLDPNPHYHDLILDNHTGALTHSSENHVNPYYALAYIMRVN